MNAALDDFLLVLPRFSRRAAAGGTLLLSVAAIASTLGCMEPDPGPAVGQAQSAVAGATNVALASNGGVVTVSSTYTTAGYNFGPAGVNDNVRAANWGHNGGWNDATYNAFPDWAQVQFMGQKTIDKVVVYSVQDNFQNPIEPTNTMVFSRSGLVGFTVQGWGGTGWVTLGTVAGNNLVKRTVSFAPYTTDRIRISITSASDGYSRLTELEAWGVPAGVCGPPSVALSSPVNGQRATPPASLSLAATASTVAGCGTIAQVQFYNGATLLATSTTSPYAATWTSVPSGVYGTTAKATDSAGRTATSAITYVTVDQPPTVGLTAPTSGLDVTAPATVALAATAADADGTITRVDFLANGNVIGGASAPPYTFTWSSVAAGSYQLTARATDNRGVTATSAPVTIAVAAPPTIALVSPTSGQVSPPGAAVTMSASCAADTAHGRGLTSVTFTARNSSNVQVWSATVPEGGGATCPFFTTWTPTISGTFTITAAATDSFAATAASAPATLLVDARPVVAVTSDLPSYSIAKTAQLSATATDADGTIQSVTFYANATAIGTGSLIGPGIYGFDWSTNVIGTYSVTARATDNLGAITTSTAISIAFTPPVTTVVYFHNDLAGTPIVATNAAGTVLWKESYEPFGNRYTHSDDDLNENATWFGGKPTEDSTGLSYFGARWYSPELGRFYSVDPVRFREDQPLSFNRYAYSNNNPYTYVDPTGAIPSLAMLPMGIHAFNNLSPAERWTAVGTIAALGVIGVEAAAAAGVVITAEFAIQSVGWSVGMISGVGATVETLKEVKASGKSPAEQDAAVRYEIVTGLILNAIPVASFGKVLRAGGAFNRAFDLVFPYVSGGTYPPSTASSPSLPENHAGGFGPTTPEKYGDWR